MEMTKVSYSTNETLEIKHVKYRKMYRTLHNLQDTCTSRSQTQRVSYGLTATTCQSHNSSFSRMLKSEINIGRLSQTNRNEIHQVETGRRK